MLIYEAVEVLVEEEEARAYEGCVLEVQLTLCHVCNLQRCRGTQGGLNAFHYMHNYLMKINSTQ